MVGTFGFFAPFLIALVALAISLSWRPFARHHDHLIPGTPRSYRRAG